MDVEVISQVVWILGPISAKVPWTNTHIHILYDHSTVPSIQSVVQDFKLDLEFFKSDVPALLPTDDDDDDEAGPYSKCACFMAPPMNCWDEKDSINIYRSEVDINAEIVDATGLTNNLSFEIYYDKYVSSSLSSHTAADYLQSNAAKAQFPQRQEVQRKVLQQCVQASRGPPECPEWSLQIVDYLQVQ